MNFEDLERRKEALLKDIDILEQKKKEIIDFVQRLVSEYSSKKISRQEYEEKLGEVFKDKSVEDWIKYIDEYIDYYENQIKFAEDLIKRDRKRYLLQYSTIKF